MTKFRRLKHHGTAKRARQAHAYDQWRLKYGMPAHGATQDDYNLPAIKTIPLVVKAFIFQTYGSLM